MQRSYPSERGPRDMQLHAPQTTLSDDAARGDGSAADVTHGNYGLSASHSRSRRDNVSPRGLLGITMLHRYTSLG